MCANDCLIQLLSLTEQITGLLLEAEIEDDQDGRQGSLLISKLEFLIKSDFRGLGFLYVGPMQFFLYNGGSFFYKRVHIRVDRHNKTCKKK